MLGSREKEDECAAEKCPSGHSNRRHTAIMRAAIGSNTGAVASHLHSDVSLKAEACADASTFFARCAVPADDVGKSPPPPAAKLADPKPVKLV